MQYRRMVVKIGTSTLTQGTSAVQYPCIVELARQIHAIQERDYQIILVSSGAITAGKEALEYPNLGKHIPAKQMLAAVGQPRLMAIYEQVFSMYGIKVGQVLLTRPDFTNRKSYINARGTFELLLNNQILPIVNENDTIATDEIGIGDNDNLSALVATMLEAEMLVLLTDIDGVYDGDPSKGKASVIKEIRSPEIPQKVWNAVGKSTSGLGTGGMITKIEAAEIARRSGTAVVVARGADNVLVRIADGEKPGTWIYPSMDAMESRKRYLLAGAAKGCGVQIDTGAWKALLKGGSLLPVGIKNVHGSFQRGDAVFIFDPEGTPCALGRCAYSSDEAEKIKGLHTNQIEETLGYSYAEEMIHHDNLVLLRGRKDDHAVSD